MGAAVVLPVKSFGRAKRRLAGALGEADRRRLMGAMLGDVLASLTAAGGWRQLIVVTAEPEAARAALAAGARLVGDPLERGHSEAAALGVQAARGAGAERVLLVPADCPLLDPADVRRLLAPAAAAGARMEIVADRAGRGTNALLLEPPAAVAPSFGPGSFARHVAAARAAGVRVRAPALASLQLDVDTPDDLCALAAALRERPARAPRTAELLGRLGGERRVAS